MDARGRLIAAVAVVVSLSSVACKRKPPPESVDAGPRDHLAKDEAPEGRERVFALTLPQASSIKSRYDGTFTIGSALSPEQMSNFVRARVREGKVVSGTSSTRFDAVVVPSEPQRRLTIDIRPAALSTGFRTEMTIRDVTPAPVEPNVSDEERWRRAGLRPDGRPLDPRKLE